jgi:hypothetical protein
MLLDSISSYRECMDRSPVILVSPSTAADIASLLFPRSVHVIDGTYCGPSNVRPGLHRQSVRPAVIVDNCPVFSVVGMVDGFVMCTDEAGFNSSVRVSSDGTFLAITDAVSKEDDDE